MIKQAQQPTIQLKRQEIQQLLQQFLGQMAQVIADKNTGDTAKTQWLNKMVENLKKQIDTKVNEDVGQKTVTVAPQAQKVDDPNLKQLLHRTKDKPYLKNKIQELWAYISKNLSNDNWQETDTGNVVAGVRGTEIIVRRKLAKRDLLEGGKGDSVPYEKLNKKQLEKGIKVEMEHTNNQEIAKEIAGDHLAEQLEEGKTKEEQDYYDELEKIEPHHKEKKDDAKDKVPAFWRKNLDYGA